jgi:hypothetical protein
LCLEAISKSFLAHSLWSKGDGIRIENFTKYYGNRLALIGDSDFAANRHFRNGNNSTLFLTAVNWLTAGVEHRVASTALDSGGGLRLVAKKII